MRKIKCVVVGDGAVGKASLSERYTTNQFSQLYVPVIFEHYCTSVIINGVKYTLDIHVTAGQEDYDRLRPLSYPQTDVFLICFSVVNPNSFENIKYRWLPEITHHNPKTPFLLIGTKIDLRNDTSILQKLGEYKKKIISMEEGKNLAKEIKAVKYFECSALTQLGLKNIFDEVISIALKSPKRSKKKSSCKLF